MESTPLHERTTLSSSLQCGACQPGSLGYSPVWRDTVHYIEDITYRIWEQREISLIESTYSKICPVYTLQGSSRGRDVVISSTKATLALFPDRTLFPEEVLWNGDNGSTVKDGFDEPDEHDNVAGYHSSHLISSRMTYNHSDSAQKLDSDFTPSCHGRRARIWVIAHCIIRDSVIVKEWLVRDNQHLLKQLGIEADGVARKWSEKWLAELRDNREAPKTTVVTHHAWLKSEYDRVTKLQLGGIPVGIDLQNILPASCRERYRLLAQAIAQQYKKIWGKEGMSSRQKFGELLRGVYHPHARFESPQGQDVVGYQELEDLYDTFVLGNNLGKDIAISQDWIIVSPHQNGLQKFTGERSCHGFGTESEDSYCHGFGTENNGYHDNAWKYPGTSDVHMRTTLIEQSLTPPILAEIAERFTVAIRWTLVGTQQSDTGLSLPVVLMAESHLRCAGIRIQHDITVYDAVALKAQLQLAKQLQS